MITDVVIDDAITQHPRQRNMLLYAGRAYQWERKEGAIAYPLRLVKYIPVEVVETTGD